MVVIEEVEVPSAADHSAAIGELEPDLPAAALAVTGAGLDDANGLYIPTGRTWHGAPVLENDRKCLLSREPHRSQKTGKSSYGWILGLEGKPLYAVQSERLTPPKDGWRKFQGMPPPPSIQAFAGESQGAAAIAAAAAAAAAGLAFKEQGNALFASSKWTAAETCWTRALEMGDYLQDQGLRVALFSNRAQVRLKRRRWPEALADAEEALRVAPTHDKALYRAAVACREMKSYRKAIELAEQCVKAHPEHPDAEKLLADVRELEEEESQAQQVETKAVEAKATEAKTSKATEAKPSETQEAQTKAAEKEPANTPTKAAPGYMHEEKDNLKGAKVWAPPPAPRKKVGFEGYSNGRSNEQPRLPLHKLPYHQMGLPKEQTDLMDKFFTDMRKKKDEIKKKKEREAKQNNTENKVEQPPEPAPPTQSEIRAARRAQLQQELEQEKKEKARKAKMLNREAKDACEAAKDWRKGEPTRFEQAASEVYAWWELPPQIRGEDCKVTCSKQCTWLTVKVRGVTIFDRELYMPIRGDDIVWTVDEGLLHVTLTKVERHKLWECLAKVQPVEWDEDGNAIPESLPEPMSGGDRLEFFKQMVEGDDGVRKNWDELDRETKELLDAMRRYEGARARGDMRELALAEMDLEEFGRFVI